MGGRGASSGVSVKGKKYGTEYRTLLQYKNIKFVQYNDARNSKVPMETMTKGRIYVTVGKGGPRSISLYNRKGLRLAQIDIAGTPAIFIDTVQISAIYISNGLFDLLPNSNATVGEVGVNITSYLLKHFSNSCLTNVRTCCAFL